MIFFPGTDINVNYTPIAILPSTSGFTNTGNISSNIMASSPPGTSVHYSTILMDANAASLLQAADPTDRHGTGNNLLCSKSNSDQIDTTPSSKDENSSSYMIMSPQGILFLLLSIKVL